MRHEHSNSTHGIARRRGRRALAAALAATLTLAFAPSAWAKLQTVGGGKTVLRINAASGEFLADAGAKLRPIKPAKEKKSGLQFPIKEGELDDKKVKGNVKHDGGFRLQGSGEKFKLTKPIAKFGKRPNVTMRVGKKSSKVFELDTDKAKVKKKGEKITVSGVRVITNGRSAGLIEDVTGEQLQDPEFVFGKLKVAAKPGDLSLRSGAGRLALDGGITQAFSAAGINPSAVEPATVNDNGRFAFPISKGKVSADGTSGNVRLDGGLGLTRGGTSLDLSKPRINLDDGEVTAVVGDSRIPTLAFDAAEVEIAVKKKQRVTISGVTTALGAEGASAINEAFGTNAFSEGQPFGEFTVKGRTGKAGGGDGDGQEDQPPDEG